MASDLPFWQGWQFWVQLTVGIGTVGTGVTEILIEAQRRRGTRYGEAKNKVLDLYLQSLFDIRRATDPTSSTWRQDLGMKA